MIRILVFGAPLALAALMVAALVNTTRLSKDPANEMLIGVMGEASTLNPIGRADAAASQVFRFIFNSLLTYDQDLEITTELAQSWTQSQTGTFYFPTETEARAAAAALEAAEERFEAWHLTGLEASSTGIPGADGLLQFFFDLPGLDAMQEIAEVIAGAGGVPLELHNLRVTGGDVRGAVRELRAGGGAEWIVRTWFSSSSLGELTVPGDAETAAENLRQALAGVPEIEVTPGEPASFLAEPELFFELRDDVRWHDGEPFTSADVLFTYEAIMNDAVASPRKPDFILIQSVEAEGPFGVRVRYRTPYSPALMSWMIPIIPAHILRDRPVEWWPENFDRRPIGTGPFKFSEWQTSQFIRLTRNPDYFEGPPWLDGIMFRVLPDLLTQRIAFETRQIDFWAADPWAVGAIQDNPDYDLFTSPQNAYTYIGWNLEREIFQDLRVRQALAHAVNVPEMIKYILYGRGTRSTGIFTPELWFFDPDIQPLEYDPQRARELLAEAGWKPGPDGRLRRNGELFSFTLITNNANEARRDIATIVQDNLRALGIDVAVETYEWSVFLSRYIDRGDFDATVLGWSLSRDWDQYQIWHSSQTNPGQLNFVNFHNPEVDSLLERIRQEYDREKIIELAHELQKILYDEQPYLYLYVPEATSVMWKDAYRICRPDGEGGWIDTPVEMTRAGWGYYMNWFYRPEFGEELPPERVIRNGGTPR